MPAETAQILKVDTGLGLVFGWAIVCKVDGEDYYDLNIDFDTGERVPEHIPEDAMLKAALAYSTAPMSKDMHQGDFCGRVPFLFPMTTDIAKALGFNVPQTGLLIAMKPDSPEILAKFASGEYTGFSIGGYRQEVEEIDG